MLARVPLDARPVSLDEVELGVVLGEEDAVVALRDDEFLDGVLLLLEVALLREEELEAACRAARPAGVLRDIDAPAFADARLSHGGLPLRLARGGARALELGRRIDKLALEEDLLDALRVPDEAGAGGADGAGLVQRVGARMRETATPLSSSGAAAPSSSIWAVYVSPSRAAMCAPLVHALVSARCTSTTVSSGK